MFIPSNYCVYSYGNTVEIERQVGTYANALSLVNMEKLNVAHSSEMLVVVLFVKFINRLSLYMHNYGHSSSPK